MRLIKWLVPVFVSIVLFFSIEYKEDYLLFPNEDIEIEYRYDKDLGGSSQMINTTVSSDSVKVTYILREGYQYPYFGVILGSKSNEFLESLSGYDLMEFDISADPVNELRIFLLCYENRISNTNNPLTFRHLTKAIPSTKNGNLNSVNLRKFKTPSWWYSNIGISENEFGEPQLNKILHMNVHSSVMLKTGVEQTIVIRSIRFTKDYFHFIVWSLSISFVYYTALLFLATYRRKIIRRANRVITYKAMEVIQTDDSTSGKAISFLSEHYNNPQLSLDAVAFELGISKRKISESLNAEFKLSFKQYLNSIRLNESKRLLTETDLPVNEIAYKVGFNNISHFNRTFRQYNNSTPNEFRNSKAES